MVGLICLGKRSLFHLTIYPFDTDNLSSQTQTQFLCRWSGKFDLNLMSVESVGLTGFLSIMVRIFKAKCHRELLTYEVDALGILPSLYSNAKLYCCKREAFCIILAVQHITFFSQFIKEESGKRFFCLSSRVTKG